MNEEIKAKWVAALRSGEYKQTTGVLRTKDHFCCLGVLCELAAKEGIIKCKLDTDGYFYYDDEKSVLPQSIVDWADTDDSNPRASDSGESLAELNDNMYPFEQIADIIEERL